MDNFVGIIWNFKFAITLEINWHKSVAYWCGCGTQLGWVEKYEWKWAIINDLSKFLSTPFSLNLD